MGHHVSLTSGRTTKSDQNQTKNCKFHMSNASCLHYCCTIFHDLFPLSLLKRHKPRQEVNAKLWDFQARKYVLLLVNKALGSMQMMDNLLKTPNDNLGNSSRYFGQM